MPDELKFNPFAIGSESELVDLALVMCADGLSRPELERLVSEISVIIPALVELRDRGVLELNAHVIADYASLDGLVRLSADPCLSTRARTRCKALHDDMLVSAIHREVLRRWFRPLQ